jgi:hypothetical protein
MHAFRILRSRMFAVVVLAGALFASACATSPPPRQVDRVLFVGNSLTYVGNLPAVFEALSNANGMPVASDMIVQGGATLAQRLDDGSVAQALATNRYSAVILQERGGDLIGAFGPDAGPQSRRAIRALAELARAHGAEALLLGSYQTDPEASRRLQAEEDRAAAEAGIGLVPVSGALWHARTAEPELQWLAPDGMHPGRDLVLLMAVLLHRAVHGTLPEPRALTVRAPVYGTGSGLRAQLRRAGDPPPLPDTPVGLEYTADQVEALVRAAVHRE